MSEFLAMAEQFIPKTDEQLKFEEAQRQALETAARYLEQQPVSHAYRAAFKKAAKLLRSIKP